jgi:hypothetical protein
MAIYKLNLRFKTLPLYHFSIDTLRTRYIKNHFTGNL